MAKANLFSQSLFLHAWRFPVHPFVPQRAKVHSSTSWHSIQTFCFGSWFPAHFWQHPNMPYKRHQFIVKQCCTAISRLLSSSTIVARHFCMAWKYVCVSSPGCLKNLGCGAKRLHVFSTPIFGKRWRMDLGMPARPRSATSFGRLNSWKACDTQRQQRPKCAIMTLGFVCSNISSWQALSLFCLNRGGLETQHI